MKFTKTDILKIKANKLEIGESFNKLEFIDEHDYEEVMYPNRAFEASFAKVKQMLPHKEFKMIKGNVTRIK